jgi:hypothetical protein
MQVNIQKRLIEKGYFPDEMGFWFTSKIFAEQIKTIANEISYNPKIKSKCLQFSTPKGKFNRREISLVNPYHYFFLSREIANNWECLEEQFNKSNISLTRPIFKSSSERAISRKYSFEDITSIFLTKSVGANYLLKIDISRYYSSIYTHSIPWALHTKEIAKANRGNNYIGNVLDQLSRNLQDGQTKGIPTGQDTSLIISEIIGTAMDEEIINKIDCMNMFRYVDDYYLFLDKKDDAEKALQVIRSILRGFELQINEEKTGIHNMPQSLEPKWLSQINSLSIDEDHLISFINNIYSIMLENPSGEVLRYAFARLKRTKIKKEQWGIIQAFLLNSFIYDATAAPLACSILSQYYHRKYGINKKMVLQVVYTLLNQNNVKDCEYELLWAFWICKLLKIKLEDELLKKTKSIKSPLLILILLNDYRHNSNLNTAEWREFMTKDELYGDRWILAYEALKRGWLPSKDGTNYIKTDEFFSLLDRNNIYFFNTRCREEWIDGNIEEKWLPMFSPAF